MSLGKIRIMIDNCKGKKKGIKAEGYQVIISDNTPCFSTF